jgi:5'-3' exonuclease
MKTAIIDCDHILYMCLHGIKRLDELGLPIKEDNKFVYDPKPFELACEEANKYLHDILQVTEAEAYIGFIGGSSKERKEVNSDYKSNRTKERPANFIELMTHLRMNWNIFLITDHETDDYVASYAKQIPNSFTVSPDKDINGLIGDHWNPKRIEWTNVNDHYARLYFWSSMITGDSSDGVKGLPGKGPKYAERVLESIHIFKDTVGSIILTEYIEHHKDLDVAIEEYYKNYKSLKIKDNLPITFEVKEYAKI